MAFPDDWVAISGGGLKRPENIRGARVYYAGTATANFIDTNVAFRDLPGAAPYDQTVIIKPGAEKATISLSRSPSGGTVRASPFDAAGTTPLKPQVWVRYLQIWHMGNVNVDLEFSFDGVDVHGVLEDRGTPYFVLYPDRYEGGIALRGLGVEFKVEGW